MKGCMTNSEPETSDADVIERSILEPHFFGTIFDRQFGNVHAFIARRIDRSSADDLAAEVFVIAFAGRAQFVPVHDSSLPWLYGIATNLVRHALKRRDVQARALHFVTVSREIEDAEEDGDDRLDVLMPGALESLPSRDRDALLLHYWEELSYEETACALGIPIGTVRSRIHRAKRQLRKRLERDLQRRERTLGHG